ncbi:ABC-2 transporter permease [Clostridium sp.]|jgi:ABC-2 type transport system permease protein|uniref:ABC-2 transporter permease n=1 Tax=Clostridium sp. TaxID=1506 RepID=UPI0025C152DA|nr:ABC-2 transporter permease [Clostridium sp.]MCI9070344.1 ABC-2 transporter permease [Clostridium sp.]MCI9302660.1 ABC-2 transporter permease [Clostridium sp.]
MNNIGNLLKLQFNSLLAIKKNLLIILALEIFFTIVQPTMIVFTGAMYLMLATYSITYYEERSKMNYLIYSLPVKTNEYILSKYIYCLLNTAIAMIITTILSTFVKILGVNDLISSMPISSMPLVTLGIGLFFTSILMPATLLIGFENGRYVLMFIAIFPVVFSTTLMEILSEINIILNPLILTILLVLISITLLLSSYFITCNKFAKKEVR